jgi:hypothetical protein
MVIFVDLFSLSNGPIRKNLPTGFLERFSEGNWFYDWKFDRLGLIDPTIQSESGRLTGLFVETLRSA